MNAIRTQARLSHVKACVPPSDSLLMQGAKQYPNSIHDCFGLDCLVLAPPEDDKVNSFAQSFFQSRAFAFESMVLKTARWFFPLDEAPPKSFGSAFFRVTQETQHEVILDSGPFLTWLAIYPPKIECKGGGGGGSITRFRFGTLTKEPNWLIHALYPIHSWYSKLLLASGVSKHLERMQRSSTAR